MQIARSSTGTLAVLLLFAASAPAQAQWETVHAFAPRGTSRFPFQAQDERVVYAAPDSVFGSTDGGLTFVGRNYRTDLGLDLGGSEPVMGAGTWDGDVLLGSVCPARCLTRSSDGQTWTRVPAPTSGFAVSGLAMGVAGRGNVLVVVTQPITGTTTFSTIWRSDDSGASWRYAQTPNVLDKPIWMGVVANRFFLITGDEFSYDGSLYSSADGDTWAPVTVPTGGGPWELQQVDVVVESGGTLFASASGPGLVKSTDGGATWAIAATDLNNQRPFSLVGLGGGRLAGRVGSQHMKSLDYGATWTASCPLYGVGYGSDDFEPSSQFLFTRAGGQIGRIAYSACGLTAPPVAAEETPAEDVLAFTIGPNPTAGDATVRFSLASAGMARVSVHDLLGREVLVVRHALGAGSQSLSFDVSGLAPGVYVARVAAGPTVSSVRFTITR